MTEQYIGWALVVGIALGAAAVWFVLGRIPRRSDDVAAEERAAEAAWISRTIESRGGFAPPALVEEVLELHIDYLAGPPLELAPTPESHDWSDHADANADATSDADVATEAEADDGRLPIAESELADERRQTT